ncbi:MAG: tRNA dihydrouridine synthase DusB [Spirochaetaceae bacterium]|jgi:nifR3 family TIM-barrel protein|nr:tRNA dihydrouridine synthase DusB [Spirochaetaceae bacterium]
MPLYHPVTLGALTLPGNIFLAPVAGWTDRAFRSICAEYGADFSFTELASSEAIVRGPEDPRQSKTGALMRRGPEERRYAIQLFGSGADTMYRAALRLAPFAPDAIDINAGCPVPKVVRNGAGCALLNNIPLLARIVSAVVKASEEALGGIPVTVKIRSGWDNASINYRESARAAQEAGAALVTLHPRTRAQYYAGKSDWSHIADLAGRLDIPVAGSGDLFSAEDAKRMLTETRSAAVMFARGAEGNPFIFAETRALLTGTAWTPPAPGEHIAAAFRHLEILAGDIGEYAAAREMRKQFAAYTKGIPGGAKARSLLVRASSAAEFRAALSALPLREAGESLREGLTGTGTARKLKSFDT